MKSESSKVVKYRLVSLLLASTPVNPPKWSIGVLLLLPPKAMSKAYSKQNLSSKRRRVQNYPFKFLDESSWERAEKNLPLCAWLIFQFSNQFSPDWKMELPEHKRKTSRFTIRTAPIERNDSQEKLLLASPSSEESYSLKDDRLSFELFRNRFFDYLILCWNVSSSWPRLQ